MEKKYVVCGDTPFYPWVHELVVELEKKYVVCGDTPFYPWVHEFDNLEEAKAKYDESDPSNELNVHGQKITIYICEVVESKIYREGQPKPPGEINNESLQI